MDGSDDRAQFVQRLIEVQPRLFGYIATLLGNVHDANNVLQETNMTLWTKADDFVPGTNFRAWAREVAYYKALSFARDARRDRLIVDHALVERIFAESDDHDEDERRIALRHCLSQLDDRQRQLLRRRYEDGASMEQLARQQQRSVGAIKMVLRRIRLALIDCVQHKLSASS